MMSGEFFIRMVVTGHTKCVRQFNSLSVTLPVVHQFKKIAFRLSNEFVEI